MNKDKIRFVILKETESTLLENINKEKFNSLELGFEWTEFEQQVNFLVREQYITRPFYADNTIYLYNSSLTKKGEDYLEDNKWHKKAYGAAKEIKEWLSI